MELTAAASDYPWHHNPNISNATPQIAATMSFAINLTVGESDVAPVNTMHYP